MKYFRKPLLAFLPVVGGKFLALGAMVGPAHLDLAASAAGLSLFAPDSIATVVLIWVALQFINI